MNIDSLKKRIICNYSLLSSVEGLEFNELTLVTAGGIIIGTPVIDSEPDSTVELYENANDQICKRYREDNNINNETPLPGNDGFLELKDVTLITGTTRTYFKFLNVFFDQVIAVTINEPNN